jgi:hypothetical protein
MGSSTVSASLAFVATVAMMTMTSSLVGAAGVAQEEALVSSLEDELRVRLVRAGDLLAQSQFDSSAAPIRCSCENYCTGRCFAPACGPCPASTWSWPGGKSSCLDPFPLGRGLLCAYDPATGNVTQQACCRVGGTSCQLDPTSCCADGGCSKCPAYPPQPAGLFPLLNRTFINDQCVEN